MIITRYPETRNHTLQACNAADEHLLDFISQTDNVSAGDIILCNDRFGFLTCSLMQYEPSIYIQLASQQKAIRQNLDNNHLRGNTEFLSLFGKPEKKKKWALVNIPKSNDLLDYLLYKICENAEDDIRVVCGFMTRHFTSSWLDIAGKYFNKVEQSKAWKKSRLMLLSDIKKPLVRKSFVHEIRYGDICLKQYHGVFSREKVDMATQFLLENLIVKEEEKNILDWGCGNGIIGLFIRQKSGPKNIVFMDDNILAVESVRLNEPDEDVRWADNLAGIPDAFFDLIVTNPPFHFEYETDISVSLSFFEEAKRCLTPEGRLLVVANKHVNYQTHLIRHFRNVEVTNENHKFIIYQNTNPSA